MNDQAKDFVAGTAGGMSLVLAGHPLDTIKVRLQTSSQFTGMMDCVSKTLQHEGVRGLYKGMTSPLIGVTPIYSIIFWSYGGLKRWLHDGSKDEMLSLSKIALAGGGSGIATTIVTTPTELVKARLQIQYAQGTAEYKGTFDAAKKILARQGIRGLYKGTMVTLLRDVPASAVYFGGYEWIRRMFIPKGGSISDVGTAATLFAGGMAGVFNWIAVFPIDLVKSRLQTQPDTQPPKYTGTLDCMRKVVKAEGVAGLYRGIVPALVRSFPANAACFAGYELTMKMLDRM